MSMRYLLYAVLSFVLCCIISCTGVTHDSGNNTQNDILALFEQAKEYECKGDAGKALMCYLNAIDMLSEKQDTLLKISAYTCLGDFHFKYGMYEKAVENHREGYNIALRLNNDKLVSESAGRIGVDYLMLNQKDTARYFMERYGSVTFESGLRNVLKDNYGVSMFATGQKDINSIINTVKADSLGTLDAREKLSAIESDFMYDRLLSKKEKEKVTNIVKSALVIFTIGIFSAVTVFFYQGRRKAENNLTNIIKDDIDRKQYYTARESELSEHEKKLKSREEQLLSDESIVAVSLINRMKSSPVYMPVKSSEEWTCLFAFSEKLYPGFVESLESVEGLTLRDKEISCLTKLGFTTGQLAVFYGISPGSVTKAKFRIQKKIEASHISEIGLANV